MHLPPRHFRGFPRFGRLAEGIAATLAAVLCTVFLTASSAMAESHLSYIPFASGDTPVCALLPADGNGTYSEFCVALGLYTNSEGEHYVTAQAYGLCVDSSDELVPCSNIVIKATVANGGGYTDWTTMACGHTNGSCESGYSYFYPFGGLEISAGQCYPNVWVVIDQSGSYITYPVSGLNKYLTSNLEDGHFSTVCLLDNGTFMSD